MYIINLTNNIANETPVWSITKAVRNCITNKAITYLNIRKKKYNTYQWLRCRHAAFEFRKLEINNMTHRLVRAATGVNIVQPTLMRRRADTDLSPSSRSRQVVVGPTTVVVWAVTLKFVTVGIFWSCSYRPTALAPDLPVFRGGRKRNRRVRTFHRWSSGPERVSVYREAARSLLA